MWQQEALDTLRAQLHPDPDVLALAVFGSFAEPDHLDAWSDLDILLVVRTGALPRFFPVVDWLEAVGSIYAMEQHVTATNAKTRLCTGDGGCVDTIIVEQSMVVGGDTGAQLLAGKHLRVVFARHADIAAVLSGPYQPKPLVLPDNAQFQTMADRFWFRGMKAVAIIARGDLLIGLHLVLEMEQDCCVLGMMLRDRREGTTHHRASADSDIAARLEAPSARHDASGLLDRIEACAALFDALSAEWQPGCPPKREPLRRVIQQARQERPALPP